MNKLSLYRTLSETDLKTNTLEPISVLFIPLEFFGTHYERNAKNGVLSRKGVLIAEHRAANGLQDIEEFEEQTKKVKINASTGVSVALTQSSTPTKPSAKKKSNRASPDALEFKIEKLAKEINDPKTDPMDAFGKVTELGAVLSEWAALKTASSTWKGGSAADLAQARVEKLFGVNQTKLPIREFCILKAQSKPLAKAKIGESLPNIVRRECADINGLYQPKDQFEHTLAAYSSKGDKIAKQVEKRLNETAWRSSPIILFLSENPTGEDFPREIDAGDRGGYVRHLAINKSSNASIRGENEIAVYLRKDYDERLKLDNDLYFEVAPLTRAIKGDTSLFQAEKDEYMVKATIGRRAGESFSVAGVHLRATLTKVSVPAGPEYRKEKIKESAYYKEVVSLKQFCTANGVQLLVGDFNLDIQRATELASFAEDDKNFLYGSHGAVSMRSGDARVIVRKMSGAFDYETYLEYPKQYSSSNDKAHYMGFLQVDLEDLTLTGIGVYGHMGGSGSRALETGEVYSDHPSIYVRANSVRVTDKAFLEKVEHKQLRQKESLKRLEEKTLQSQREEGAMKEAWRQIQLRRAILAICAPPTVTYRTTRGDAKFSLIDVATNGDCLFSSIAQAANRQDGADGLRAEIVQFLDANPNLVPNGMYLQEGNGTAVRHVLGHKPYIDAMRERTVWGGLTEIVAYSHTQPIILFEDAKPPVLYQNGIPSQIDWNALPANVIFIAFNVNHYMALRPA